MSENYSSVKVKIEIIEKSLKIANRSGPEPYFRSDQLRHEPRRGMTDSSSQPPLCWFQQLLSTHSIVNPGQSYFD